ncbi:MAG: hypothetical protein Q8P84_08920 [Deltaproteobacteria bacterium]|nr:hypothetical protein [Deltaproteobacteria bacterium]
MTIWVFCLLSSVFSPAFAATGVVIQQGGGLYFVTPQGKKVKPQFGDEFYNGYKVYNTKGRAVLLLFYGDLIDLEGKQKFQAGEGSVKPRLYLPPPYTALEDAINVAKMGPVGVKAPLAIHPPVGGIQGIFPIYGDILPSSTLQFEWRGKDILGEKPVFIIFEKHSKEQKIFSLKAGAKKFSINPAKEKIKEGAEYHWYLGRIKNGKPVAQTRVYSFEILSEKNQKKLSRDLEGLSALKLSSREGETFLKSQIFYHYKLYHNMIDSILPMYQKRPSRSLRRILYLGFVRLGRYSQAQKYEEKN